MMAKYEHYDRDRHVGFMTCVQMLNLPVEERAISALGAKASDPTRNRDVTRAVNFILDMFDLYRKNLKLVAAEKNWSMKERNVKAAEVSSRAQPMIKVSKLWRGVNVASGWAVLVPLVVCPSSCDVSCVKSVQKSHHRSPAPKSKLLESKNADTHACSTLIHRCTSQQQRNNSIVSFFLAPSALQIVPSTQYSKT
eukprot:scaffold1694_cov122-Skeletonema_dohrnii-CCMP3373.AAC.10